MNDDPSADLSKAAREATTFINKAREEGTSNKIFVHCSAGISRSPAIVAYYLMRSCDMSLKRALGLVISARPNACPNHGFMSQLQQAELEIRGASSFNLLPDLAYLPSKREARLVLRALLEDQKDDASNQQLSKSSTFEGNEETPHDHPGGHD